MTSTRTSPVLRAARVIATCAIVSALSFGRALADQSVDQLVKSGRELLAQGKAREAQKLFEDAATKDSHSLRTEQWVIRSWLPQGRINDALNAADELARAGNTGPAMDYLFGMAFATKAQTYIGQQVNGQIIEMSFADAVGYLEKATRADPELYKDAFAPLAQAARYMQKFDVARAAADKAVAIDSSSADAHMVLGQIAIAQYSAAKDDATKASEAEKHWDTARAAFARATELFDARGDAPSQTAAAALQLGHTFAWKQKSDEAARAYSTAIAADPRAVDFRQVLDVLKEPPVFLKCLEDGERARNAKTAGETKADATLLWWLGWAQFENKKFADAEPTLQKAVQLNPTFTTSWFYIAQTRYAQKSFGGAVDALRRYFEEDPAELGLVIAQDAETNLAILDYLVGWCANNERILDAGMLSEVQSIAEPTVARYWNNAGLFYRDTAERLMKSDKPEDQKTSIELFDRAYKAYSQALELTPEDPSVLNDTAVMLHYYLKRDLDRARELYIKARDIAGAELTKAELSDEVRKIYMTALRDSKNNLAKLDREIAK